jgi:shikimate kinase
MVFFLIGFMGSGKTHWGSLWAKQLNYNFIDLDEVIEKKYGKTIAKIFEENGEDFFRQKETEILQSLVFEKPTIVACGGGTPCFNNNIDWMNKNGTTIYLKTTVNDIFERVMAEQQKRPLIKNLNEAEVKFFIEQKLNERELYYNKAAKTIHTNLITENSILHLLNA